MVRSMTTSCRLKFGIKRTSFKILNNRNVRKTDSPEPPSPSPPIKLWNSSTKLGNFFY